MCWNFKYQVEGRRKIVFFSLITAVLHGVQKFCLFHSHLHYYGLKWYDAIRHKDNVFFWELQAFGLIFTFFYTHRTLNPNKSLEQFLTYIIHSNSICTLRVFQKTKENKKNNKNQFYFVFLVLFCFCKTALRLNTRRWIM